MALLKQIKRRTFGRAKYNQESPDTDQSAEERLTQAEHVHTSALFKKILCRETDFHQVKIHFKQIRNPILFYSLPVFCCFSQRTAQLTANFDRQDKRISRCRFTKRKFNLISDRDAISDIANGQQIPYNLVCLKTKTKQNKTSCNSAAAR